MKVGMLWLDTDPEAALDRRVARAAEYYADKYGRRATLCVVHPDTAGDQPPSIVADLILRVRADALRQHFWIGVDEAASLPA
jgi:hypothetical protein